MKRSWKAPLLQRYVNTNGNNAWETFSITFGQAAWSKSQNSMIDVSSNTSLVSTSLFRNQFSKNSETHLSDNLKALKSNISLLIVENIDKIYFLLLLDMLNIVLICIFFFLRSMNTLPTATMIVGHFSMRHIGHYSFLSNFPFDSRNLSKDWILFQSFVVQNNS